jgi:hypothetical protein
MLIISTTILLQADPARIAGEGIGPGALLFMLLSMGSVAALTAWCFYRVIKTRKHFDPDGTGPAKPPVPGRAGPEEVA